MGTPKTTGGIKVQVHLPDPLYDRLAKAVERRGNTVSRYVREAIEEKLERDSDEYSNRIAAAVGAAIGAVLGGPGGALLGAGLGAAAAQQDKDKARKVAKS